MGLDGDWNRWVGRCMVHVWSSTSASVVPQGKVQKVRLGVLCRGPGYWGTTAEEASSGWHKQ